jgi:type I restriction enzyme S subunit
MSEGLKSGWRRVKFGDVVRQVKDRVDPETAGLDRYIAGEHMDTDDLKLRRWGDIGTDYLGPAFHMRFKPGQVLYGSRRTYLRKVAVADFEGITANTTFVLAPKEPNVLLPELLPFLMQTERFHDHSVKQSRGSVNPYVNFSDLAWYEFALPPLEEHRLLVRMLTRIVAKIEELSSASMTVDVALRSQLIDSFRPHRGTRDRFPPNWPVLTVSDAGSVQLGQQRHPKFKNGTNVRPYLRVANVMDGYLMLDDVLEMHFPEKELGKF